jgi:prepilin-type N-terminal cleavage/methylation domain-containing protein/prepilin-type processing-associated H-X9-DG protein
MNTAGKRKGLSLIETIVVMAILAIMTGLVLSAVQRGRNAAARAGCANNLRNLALAVHQHESQNGAFPQGCTYMVGTYDSGGAVGVSWYTYLLPFVEQAAIWNMAWRAITADPTGMDPIHVEPQLQIVPSFLCPSESRRLGGSERVNGYWAIKSYSAIGGTGTRYDDGIFHFRKPARMNEILDGSSNTVMIGERPPGPGGLFSGWYGGWGSCVCPVAQVQAAPSIVEWAPCNPSPPLAPGSIEDECSVHRFWSVHPGGANFALADGSVRFLRYESAAILPALATKAGGETGIGLD